MTAQPETTISTATTGDAATAADALAAAFTTDPVFSWLLPDAATRSARLRRLFTIEAASIALPHGVSHTARTSTGIVGAALVLPPGRWDTPLPVMLRHSIGYLRTFGRRLPEASVVQGDMKREHPREPHYYLAYLGVHPRAHNQGIGSALLTAILARADREGLPTYLEASNPDSARLYRRLGFRGLKTVRPGGCPPLELMLRAAG